MINFESCISDLTILLKEFQCPSDRFDWFIGVSYLIFKGDLVMTRNFLQILERFPEFSSCMWSIYSESTFGAMYSQCHVLRGMLEDYEPRITAFTLSGITPSQFASLWFRECFVNVLNFDDIATYFAGSLLFGSHFSVWTAAECISLLLSQESLSLGIRSVGDFRFKEADSWNRILSNVTRHF